jgi:hypothetical protein
VVIETFRNISRHKFISALIVLQLVFSMILCNIALEENAALENETIRYMPLWDGSNIYMVYDELRNEKEQEYFEEEGSQFRVQRYIDALESNEEYDYLICGQHPIEVIGMEVPKSMIYGESGNFIKAHQINENLLTRYPITVIQGHTFNSNHFNYNLLDVIPVILGYNYFGRYHVGDRLDVFYMGYPVTLEVVGIAAQETYFPLYEYLVYEDDYIIMPISEARTPPQSEDEEFLQKANVLQNSSGYFRLAQDQNIADLLEYLNSVGSSFGMYDIQIGRINAGRLKALEFSSAEKRDLIIGLTGIIIAFIFIQLLVTTMMNIKKNARRYSILLLAGASKAYIASLIILEIILLIIAASMLSTAFIIHEQISSIKTQLIISTVMILGGSICAAPSFYQLCSSSDLYMKEL